MRGGTSYCSLGSCTALGYGRFTAYGESESAVVDHSTTTDNSTWLLHGFIQI